MSDIYDEVNEEVRKDQVTELWNKYGLYMISVVVLVILLVVGNAAWTKYRAVQQQTVGSVFQDVEMAVMDGDTDSAFVQLKTLAQAHPDQVAYLSLMRQAELLIEQDNPSGASELYQQAAVRIPSEPLLRDLALFKLASLTLSHSGADAAQPLVENLVRLGAPYRLSALELKAIIKLETGDFEMAQQLFNEILEDSSVSIGMADRVTKVLASMKGQ